MASNKEQSDDDILVSKSIAVPTSRVWVALTLEDIYYEVALHKIAEVMIDRIGNVSYLRYQEVDDQAEEIKISDPCPLNPGVDVFVEYIPEWSPNYNQAPRILFITLEDKS